MKVELKFKKSEYPPILNPKGKTYQAILDYLIKGFERNEKQIEGYRCNIDHILPFEKTILANLEEENEELKKLLQNAGAYFEIITQQSPLE